ncbi:hypothetical protein KAFR_0D01960 [Kazachstania africana CBS 2517]|uniref:Clathrin/coatomer adaptor adaptin-like N-terminal domain-containing protein n=1 Tax=Kazachstania africana (strain ATCC 22294 / BCRC 22015 / CBS 2517 / CECT 1963 / NBRC 1671 / NRRL Y-8276) TaxID=1071382 RepID=H2ATZ3_KAZAF|nr:hypothetical protein KAFR_0D01960 [Kazachstania africana CBS 2517]CCF57843.1 hypothetical protein KAFR_0D01960 [Kazachstania africana CBS 2517]
MTESIGNIASALESAKAITLEAAAVASSKLGESSYAHYSKSISSQQLRNLLNSRHNREVKDGMKRILSIMASGDDNNNSSLDVESFFADVVKNIGNEDSKVKRMVYVYLSRYADKDPDLALLSINAIQKSLNDTNPDIRALAIKALSDIKISSLCPILAESLRKAITDSSATVRSEVAFALLKLYQWKREEYEEDIHSLLKDLLSDSEPQVISSAILLMRECFSDELDLLHGHFRYYCKIIKQLNSWSQYYLIEILIKYCKKFITRPLVIDTSSEEQDTRETIPLPDEYNTIPFPMYDIKIDDDLRLFLKQLETLRFSSNPLVIFSCCNAFYQLTTSQYFKKSKLPEALIGFLTSASENEGLKSVILQSILMYSISDSTLFLANMKIFLLFPNDSVSISVLKLKVLSALLNENNVQFILKQLKYYINHYRNERIVLESLNTLLACSNLSIELESHILNWAVINMESKFKILTNDVLNCYINIIRELVQNNPQSHLRVIIKLADILTSDDRLTNDNARAGIIWLFGEISAIEFSVCPDVLRKLIPNFVDEGVEARNQILTLAAKLLSYEVDNLGDSFTLDDSRIAKIFAHVSYLCKFDDDFDIRDRARLISSIFDSKKYEIATLLLQAPKPRTRTSEISSNELQIDKDIKSYHQYIAWEAAAENSEVEAIDIRESAPLKDYSKYKKSISSDYFMSGRNNIPRTFDKTYSDTHRTSTPSPAPAGIAVRSNNSFTSGSGQKYKLQSLDEFLSDIPTTTKTRKFDKPRKIVRIEEEDTSSEESEYDTSDESVDDEESSDEESSSSSESI